MRDWNDMAAAYLAQTANYLEFVRVWLHARTGSPIEELMADALITSDMNSAFAHPIMITEHMGRALKDSAQYGWYVQPQLPILTYRADFAIAFRFSGDREWTRVVVECDGHEWHEKTKEQAQRDKKRDREMATQGWHVLRFTGSEIWRDPAMCADQVWQYILEASHGFPCLDSELEAAE